MNVATSGALIALLYDILGVLQTPGAYILALIVYVTGIYTATLSFAYRRLILPTLGMCWCPNSLVALYFP